MNNVECGLSRSYVRNAFIKISCITHEVSENSVNLRIITMSE